MCLTAHMNMLISIYFNFFAQHHTVRGARDGEGVCTCCLSTAPPGLPKQVCPERASPPPKQCPQQTYRTTNQAESSDVNIFIPTEVQTARSTENANATNRRLPPLIMLSILSREHDAMIMKTFAGVQHTCPSATAAACCTQPQMGRTHQNPLPVATVSCCQTYPLANHFARGLRCIRDNAPR